MSPPVPLPPETPLAMPVQDLHGNPPAAIEVETRPPGLAIKRLLLIALTAVLGLAASTEVRMSLASDGLNVAEIALLIFFVPLFCWIAFGFVSFAVGFLKLISGDHPGFTPLDFPNRGLTQRVAVLMPVYNESVEAIFARVRAMARSIHRADPDGLIDFFVLSDSRADHGVAEEAAWRAVAAEAPINVYYRRREKNTARKPGNIAEWLHRFGAAYEAMLILDADSVMSGRTIAGMAAIMEQRPSVGLLQTVPRIVNAQTLFQRWMQFAGDAFGPCASAGLMWWSGSEANFWGHNAIVRTRAFAESCGLPELSGKPPFGGHILSHDMVESALLRRRGWAVHMLMIGGSYEEFPPTIMDFAIRDRRWMQGNMQHLRLLSASGLDWTSRLHLLVGASVYMTSPAWLLLLLTAIAQVTFTDATHFTRTAPFSVLILTAVLLFGPKVMSLIWILVDRGRRRAFGGWWGTIGSVLAETLLSVLFAPVNMVTQTRSLIGLLLGLSSGWTAQTREANRLSVGEVIGDLRWHIALGLFFAATAFIDVTTALWLSPLTAGLLLSPWLVSLTSRRDLGDGARRAGLFAVPAREVEVAEAGADGGLRIDIVADPA